jgi:hypothetical protein
MIALPLPLMPIVNAKVGILPEAPIGGVGPGVLGWLPLIQIIVGILLIVIGGEVAKWLVRILGAILVILGIVALIWVSSKQWIGWNPTLQSNEFDQDVYPSVRIY